MRQLLFGVSKSVSRVLSGTAIYLRRTSLHGFSHRSEKCRAGLSLLLVLHRVGFIRPVCLHTAGELLPRLSILTGNPAVVFCYTILRVASTRRYLAPLPCGARTFLTKARALPRLPNLLTDKVYHITPFLSTLYFQKSPCRP